MSLSSIISSASAALTATQYKIAVADLNVANAADTSYTRKTVQSAPTSLASSVSDSVVVRAADAYLLKTAIKAAAAAGYDAKINSYLQSYDTALGSTDGDDDVSSRLDAFQTALSALSSDASSAAAKAQVVSSAVDVAESLTALSAQIQSLRTQANGEIADTVGSVNTTLITLASLNDQIVTTNAQGGDVTTLQDQRDAALESLSSMVGVSSYVTSDNRLMVYSSGGDQLLGTSAAQLSYVASSQLGASATYPGQIAGITLNGKDVTPTLTTGALGGLISLRDDALVDEQAKLDELASTLIAQTNAVTNAGSAVPAPASLTSATTVSAADPLSATGTLRVAVTSTAGKVVTTQDLDLSSYATVGDLVDALGAISGLSAAIGSDGKLTLATTSTANGVALADLSAAVSPSGGGISAWLGLNDLFSGAAASDIAVTARLKSDSAGLTIAVLSTASGLAVGDIALASGDGAVADQLSALLSAAVSFGSAGAAPAQTTSLQAYAAGFVSGAALVISTAADQAATSTAAYSAATTRRQDLTAVNLDEETALLTQYQAQYAANAQLVSMAKDLFDTLISMVN